MESEKLDSVTDIVCLVDSEIDLETPIPTFVYDREKHTLEDFNIGPVLSHLSHQRLLKWGLSSLVQMRKKELEHSICQLTEKSRNAVRNCIEGRIRGSVLLNSPGGSANRADSITSLIKHVVLSGGQFRGYGTKDIASAAANILVSIPNPGDRVLLPDSSLFFHSGSNVSEGKLKDDVDPEILEVESEEKDDFLKLLAHGPDAVINARVRSIIDSAFSDPNNIDNQFTFSGEQAAEFILARCLESSDAMRTDFLDFHNMESFPQTPFCSGLDDFFLPKSQKLSFPDMDQLLRGLGIE